MGCSIHPTWVEYIRKEMDSVPLVSQILMVFLIYFFVSIFFFFLPTCSTKVIISKFSLLILHLLEIWRTVTNVAVVVALLCPNLYLSDKIANARTILVDNFIQCNSFIIATLCLPQKLKQHVSDTSHMSVDQTPERV